MTLGPETANGWLTSFCRETPESTEMLSATDDRAPAQPRPRFSNGESRVADAPGRGKEQRAQSWRDVARMADRGDGNRTRELRGAAPSSGDAPPHEVGHDEQIVGEHGSPHEELEALAAAEQAPFHAAPPEQHRDAALDAGAEPLARAKPPALLVGRPRGALVPPALGDALQADARRFARLEGLRTVEAPIHRAEGERSRKQRAMAVERRRHLGRIDGIAVENAVVRDETVTALGQEDLVAKFDGLLRLAALDEIGVRFEDREELVLVGDGLAVEHAPPRLLEDARGPVAVRGDLRAQPGTLGRGDRLGARHRLGRRHHRARGGYHGRGNRDQRPIFGNVLVLALPRRQALDLLHPTARAAGAIDEADGQVGPLRLEAAYQPREHAHAIPQERRVGGVVDVGLNDRGVGAEFRASSKPWATAQRMMRSLM